MASDESMNMGIDTDHESTDDGYAYDHQQSSHIQSLSRLSVCTSSMHEDFDEDGVSMFLSGLSIESFDADGENSDTGIGVNEELTDSDKEGHGFCYSLPATPSRRRRVVGGDVKEYASENEGKKGKNIRRDSRKRRVVREKALFHDHENWNSFSGDSESGYGGSGGGGLMVITKPKGGGRSLCMDLEEVKACRDLGFELEHEKMFEMPSSGGNSPIANWRISSPGDDPRDVKARLKVWAQAVAQTSNARLSLSRSGGGGGDDVYI